MTGKKLGKEKVTPMLPNANSNSGIEPDEPETTKARNTEQASTTSNSEVAAGPGNQLQENDTRPANQNNEQNTLKPGAQPDGAASINEQPPRNEGIE